MNNWNNENENRSYPFITSEADTLNHNEILDCKFYLKNPTNLKVWLSNRTETAESINYTFSCSGMESLSFTVPLDADFPVLIKASNNDMSGEVVFNN